MSDKNINILLTLQSKITGDLAKISRTLDKTKDSLNKLQTAAKQARKVTGDIAFIGTAVSGVFGLALANAGKYSLQVAKANDKLTNTYAALQVELANAVLPTYNQFINIIVNVTQYIQRLDSALKEKIARYTAIVAVVGIVIGVFGSFLVRMFSLVVGIAKLLISLGSLVISFGKIVVLFAAANPIIATLIVTIGALTIAALTASKEFAAALEPFRLFFNLIEKLPGGSSFGGITKAIEGFQTKLLKLEEQEKGQDGTKSILDNIKDSLDSFLKGLTKVNDINFSNNFAINVQRIKEEMDRIRNYKLWGNEGFFKGLQSGFSKSINELKNFSLLGQQIAEKTATAMSTYFSDSFFAIFKGDLESLQDAFSNFTDSVLRMISDIIAQYLTLTALSSAVGGPFTSLYNATFGVKHQGGAIPYAHSGRAAFDEVDLRLQKGEGVVSRLGMTTIGGKDSLDAINSGNVAISGGGQPVYISLQTWDASDILRNKKAIVSIIQDAIAKNGSIRKAVQNA